MNYEATARDLAVLVMNITDPGIEKWEREQLEIQARAKAKSYLSKIKENA